MIISYTSFFSLNNISLPSIGPNIYLIVLYEKTLKNIRNLLNDSIQMLYESMCVLGFWGFGVLGFWGAGGALRPFEFTGLVYPGLLGNRQLDTSQTWTSSRGCPLIGPNTRSRAPTSQKRPFP